MSDVPDHVPDHAADGDQSRPDDRDRAAETADSRAHGTARAVRQYRKSAGDRVGNAVFTLLARVGIGPAHLLTTRGRRTGLARSNPVVLVQHDQQRWLVAPYGAVPWVLNTRAAGRVTLRRGREQGEYSVREVSAAEAGPVLKRYVGIASATRPYFRASKDSPVADFTAEADRHPVFELTPAGEDQP